MFEQMGNVIHVDIRISLAMVCCCCGEEMTMEQKKATARTTDVVLCN
jgi:hypothetical protein